MEKLPRKVAVALAAVCLAAGGAGAESPGGNPLVLADAVVVGRCLDPVRQVMVEDTPARLVRFAVEKTLKGKVPPEVTVVLPGGIYKPGKLVVDVGVDGTVQLAPKEEALLFLVPVPEVSGGYAVAASPLGKFHIRVDEKGVKKVDRLLSGPPPEDGAPLAQLEREILEALGGKGMKSAGPK